MTLADVIDRCLVAVNISAASKPELLEKLVAKISASYPQTDSKGLFEALLAREHEASTGIGNGVAIPHAAAPGFNRPICLIARLAEPLDFDAVDGEPVRVVFVLISPQEAAAPGSKRTLGSRHIRMLARLARLCMDTEFIHKLAETEDDGEFFALLKKSRSDS